MPNYYKLVWPVGDDSPATQWATLHFETDDYVTSHDVYHEAVVLRDMYGATLSVWLPDRYGTTVIGT